MLELKPIEGAIEGFKKLVDDYVSVRICTSNLRNPFSSGEKWQWVEKWLGKKHAVEMIVCDDKTLVRGDYLIDDKPEHTGALTPEWKHIIYTQPYNTHIPGPRFSWGQDLILE